jgi:hypothetical protein
MSKVVFIYLEGTPTGKESNPEYLDVGEVQAAFNEKDELLDFWYLSDAHFRVAHFSILMSRLGIEIEDANAIPRNRDLKLQEIAYQAALNAQS